MSRRGEFRMPISELRRRFEEGGTYASIARECGVGENTVRYRARMLDVRPIVNAPPRPAPSEAAMRLALAHADLSLARIAQAFGCTTTTLSRAARAAGLPTDQAGRAALMEAR
jgi:transposase-like protein